MTGVIDNRLSTRPTIIVPDVHGRISFINRVFDVYDLAKWDVVFTGDILHREGNRDYWVEASKLYTKRKYSPNYTQGDFEAHMREEIEASIGAWQLVTNAQREFPDSIFALRGNHDDVSCRLMGDFGKYTSKPYESELFRKALIGRMPHIYGQYVIYEDTIPYLYIGADFIASHTVAYDSIRLRDISCDDSYCHQNFCWTDNVYYSGYERNFEENFYNLAGERKVNYWVIGHRPITDGSLLRIQQKGRLVQNNHPDRWVVTEIVDGLLTAREL